FGIAHPEDSTRLTETGHLVGTLRYLAPEVIDGQPASPRSDLYALGVLLRDLSGSARTDPTTEELVARLTDRTPAGRPQSAELAQRLLDQPAAPVARKQPRPPVSPTRVEPRHVPLAPSPVKAAPPHTRRLRGPARRPRGHGAALARGARSRVGRLVGIAGAGVARVGAVVVLAGGSG